MSSLRTELLVGIGIAVAIATLLISFLMFLLNRELNRRRYDESRHRADLESIRKSFEDKLYQLTDRLLATEARWRDVNHLLISGQQFSTPPERSATAAHSDFLDRAGIPEEGAAVDKRLVFVLTPFHPDFEDTYRLIAGVCAQIGLTSMRGDEEYVKGDLLQHILRLIVRARLIIANVDGRNPNVFYELGIAHALGKPVLIIASSHEALPFDVRTSRIIFWQNLEDLRSKIQQELLRVFAAGS